jgi:hypothetical protein
MMTSNVVTEARDASGFDRVTLRVDNVENELHIRQGDTESLIIHAPSDIVSRITTAVRDGQLVISMPGSISEKLQRALATSLTRQSARFELTVRDLRSLDVAGFVRVVCDSLRTQRLVLRAGGVALVGLGALEADTLELGQRGSCRVDVSGRVRQQRVVIEGMGRYEASALQSQTTAVQIHGSGKATIWATDRLEVTIRGMGLVEYRGAPRLTGSIPPMGRLVCLEGSA